MPEPGGEPLAYTTHQAARMVALSERTIRNMVNRGEIPHSRIGGRVVITRVALEALLAEREHWGHHERERPQADLTTHRQNELAGQMPGPGR